MRNFSSVGARHARRRIVEILRALENLPIFDPAPTGCLRGEAGSWVRKTSLTRRISHLTYGHAGDAYGYAASTNHTWNVRTHAR